MSKVHRYTVKQLQEMVSSGEASFEEINQIYQSRIDEINPTINAYITDTISSALDSETNQSNDKMP